MEATTLCVMLKAPHPGGVKTRLAREVGAAGAAAIYREIAGNQIREIPRGWKIEVHFAPRDAGEEMQRWLQPLREDRITFTPQADGDLGARLQTAMKSAFDRGARRVLFAGGDCPGLGSAILSESAALLDAADLVLVPALDGGYVLIGMKAPHAGVFDGIAWSTPRVLEQTLSALRVLGLEARLLPALEDVDDLPSWERTCGCLRFV